MTNELVTPKILHCPADEARTIAESWDRFSTANSSYEYLAASGLETEPTRVLARCRIHGFVALCDGSAHQLVTEQQATRLQWRDGKLYYERQPQPAGMQAGQVPQMDEHMMRRYGLAPEAIRQQMEQMHQLPDGAPQLDVEMMKRYGLLPPDAELPEGSEVYVAPQHQMDELMMRRYGLLPPKSISPPWRANRVRLWIFPS
jgi:hypothetical protein